MSEGLIPKETRALVGSSWGDPTKGEVLRKESVRFAQSVNDLNPLYFDEEYAKEAGYAGTITPPMFFHIALTPSLPLSETQPDGLFRTGRRELKLNGADRSMFGGEEVEFLAPVHPGDVLEGATEWESIEEKQGASGAFVVTVWKTTVRNQHGEIVAISHGSGIAR